MGHLPQKNILGTPLVMYQNFFFIIFKENNFIVGIYRHKTRIKKIAKQLIQWNVKLKWMIFIDVMISRVGKTAN